MSHAVTRRASVVSGCISIIADLLIHWRYPVPVFFILPAAGREIERLQLHAEWSRVAGSHWTVVYTGDRWNLHASTTHEDFIRGIQFGAVDAPLLHGDTKFIAHHVDQGIARDALEDVF